jgi:hypothetical protein
MNMQDHSYLGSGKLLLREFGSAAPFDDAGNCSALTLSPQTNQLNLADYTQPGGGNRNTVDRVTGVNMSYTFHDYAPSNFARSLRGTTAAVAAGTVTDEELVAYKGGFTPFAKIASALTTVEPAGGGTAYVAGTDYVFQDGGIYIPPTSSIPDPVAGAENIQVTYTNPAQKVTQALVNPAKQYEALFVGLKEAQSGKAVRIRAHKVSGGVLQEMGLISENYGAGTVDGALLADTTKGAGLSKYFIVEQVD